MSSSRVSDAFGEGNVTVSFGAHFQASDGFEVVFKQGMALVERTASYLDGPGRREARTLKGPMTVLYATESMRLTTRLLDLASWLLIRRALKEGEITEEEAQRKRQRVKLQSFGRPSHIKNFGELPEGLRGLIDESFKLHDRIVQIDRAMAVGSEVAPTADATLNPVGQQISLLRQAFPNKA